MHVEMFHAVGSVIPESMHARTVGLGLAVRTCGPNSHRKFKESIGSSHTVFCFTLGPQRGNPVSELRCTRCRAGIMSEYTLLTVLETAPL